MEVRYYVDTDTAYIYLLEPGEQAKVDESEEVAPSVVVDFDAEDRPVGIEIYDDARRKLAGSPTWDSEDERALEIGRAWLAGYRAAQSDQSADAGLAERGAASE